MNLFFTWFGPLRRATFVSAKVPKAIFAWGVLEPTQNYMAAELAVPVLGGVEGLRQSSTKGLIHPCVSGASKAGKYFSMVSMALCPVNYLVIFADRVN